MRKLEFLREVAKKITSEHQIYYLELPVEFQAKEACSSPSCLPVGGENGEVIGIAVENLFSCENELGEYIATRTDIYRVPFPNLT